MDKYKELWIPDGDINTAPANYKEWQSKGLAVLSLVPKKEVCIQAGGNFGYFPIKLAEHFNKVYTWEPAEDNWQCMLKNIKELSKHEDKIVMFKEGLGAKATRAKVLKQTPGNAGALQIAYSESGDIPVSCVDDLRLKTCDLIWLDIEGFEQEALVGAKKTIKKYKPVLVIENKGLIPNMGGTRDGSTQMDKWVCNLGYYKHSRILRDDIYIAKPGE